MTEKKIPREIGDIKSRYEWKKVTAPRTWRPKAIGDELVGFYGGQSVRNGQFGEYSTVLIHVPTKGSFSISGVKIVQLIDAADIQPGWPIRIVWLGKKAIGAIVEGEERHKMKNFEVYVAEGDPVAADELPKFSGAEDDG